MEAPGTLHVSRPVIPVGEIGLYETLCCAILRVVTHFEG